MVPESDLMLGGSISQPISSPFQLPFQEPYLLTVHLVRIPEAYCLVRRMGL
jgi:hypothetical protein